MAPEVRDILKMLKFYGWRQQRKRRGSHRKFTHAHKPGTVSVAGHEGEEPPEATWRSIVQQAGLPKRIIREYSTWKNWRQR